VYKAPGGRGGKGVKRTVAREDGVGRTIARVLNDPDGAITSVANANLIAASPDLLVFATQARECVQVVLAGRGTPNEVALSDIYELLEALQGDADAVIAKAAAS